MTRAKAIGSILIAMGAILMVIAIFGYFYAIYHIGGWPWEVWYGIPLFILYSVLLVIAIQFAAAFFITGNNFRNALITEKKEDYESPIIKV